MARRLSLPALALLVGAALTVAGVAGVGRAAAATSRFTLTYASQGLNTVVVRWAPCVHTPNGDVPQVIRYKVHAAGHPHRVRLVRRAMHRVHEATGLRLRYAGRTPYIPQADRLTGRLTARTMEARTGVPFVVAWAKKGHVRGGSTLLTGDEAGVGSIVWRYNLLSQLRISDAAVVIKRGHTGLRGGFGPGGTIGTLLLHELGHAVGLQHVSDGHQVMNPVIGPWSPGRYAHGDRHGLAKVGAGRGCMRGPWLPA